MPQPHIRAAGVQRHVAVIMDGNGRWAARRAMPRHLGHRAGIKAVRATVEGYGPASTAHPVSAKDEWQPASRTLH